ncbi:U32 family peptidase [Collinsella sp. An2]|uniref:U32 family peptidase n=1 Tax=Collinsella sp. An2 TaxID=1965585 RepID=UPI000B387343|nr:U32 family peptidase [Collinsella sp. An2]OUP07178.1 hypothetical protein B5F33_09190 [Collinsella sp. An2]
MMTQGAGAVPELLAPAGGVDALLAAVAAGADAVYVGAGSMNARVSAEGFTPRQLACACAYAHEHGVRVYAALNVTVYEGELDGAVALARQVLDAGADALIVADLGLASRLLRDVGGVELHLSTQAGAQSVQAVRMARELGCSRVTSARELTTGEIFGLTETGVPIEVFCHGAICISYSGACAFSACRRGRSAMRGDCTQPCRLSYGLEDEEGHTCARSDGDKLLCPRDYLGLEHLPELCAAGVASLKIEGRMKNPDYVYNVTRIYRMALDAAAAGVPYDAPALARELGRSFNRGFTDGYLRGDSGADLMSTERSCNQGVRVGTVVERRHEAVLVELEGDVAAGDTLEIRFVPGPDTPPDVPARWPQVPCTADGAAGERLWIRCKRKVTVGSVVHLVRSARVLAETSAALKRAHADLDAIEQAYAFGDLPETWADTGADKSAGASLGPRSASSHGADARASVAGAQVVLVDSVDAASRALATAQGREVAVLAWRIAEDFAAWEDLLGRLTVVLDEVLRADDVDRVLQVCSRAGRVVCRNLGQIELARQTGASFDTATPLHATNAEAVRAFARMGARRVWLSGELDADDAPLVVDAVGDEVTMGMVAAARSELMVCEHCLLTAEGPCDGRCASCSRRRQRRWLVETGGARLSVVVDARGRTRIFDERPTVRRDLLRALGDRVVWAVEAGACGVEPCGVSDPERDAREDEGER